MNERIQNLKDKIWTEEYWTNPNTDKLLPAQLNRFAELLLQDVMSICEEMGDRGMDGHYCVDKIRREFGI